MRTFRRKALAICMAALLGMASFAVLAEEPLEMEKEEVIETVESVSNGDSVIYDKSYEETSEETGDIEDEGRVEGVEPLYPAIRCGKLRTDFTETGACGQKSLQTTQIQSRMPTRNM